MTLLLDGHAHDARSSTAAPNRLVELRSDTFTLPTQRMLTAAVRAPLGDDVYGEDPTVAELEALAADILGKEAGCLMPSGTMANLTALLTHCQRGRKAVVGRESDIYVYEAGGAAVCGGISYEPLDNRPDGTIDPEALAEALDVDGDDPQFALAGVICLETPHNRRGGIPLTVDYLGQVSEMARARQVALHLDGARLFNAALALGVSPARLAAHGDTVQICLSKGLSAPIGSVLVGDRASVASARRARKMLGGGMRQAGMVAACGIVALTDMVDRLSEDHAHAARLARGLAALPGLRLRPGTPATNMVFFSVDERIGDTRQLIRALAHRGVNVEELGPGQIRAVTHAGVTTADVDRAVAVFAELLAKPPAAG
ncbi:GntG family PLP-dependent aldolase [Streptomyces sp. NPDC048155]|uniref:GntG family PLP-dependent aldolase n=1 Tax=Streptomyces sp. NPDC048155 TaxID=3154818 RepID=UPI0033E3B072